MSTYVMNDIENEIEAAAAAAKEEISAKSKLIEE